MYPIPANATRIRYLESAGTQYVDTGIIPTLSDAVSVDADMALTTIKTSDNNILFGSYYDNVVVGTPTQFSSRLFAFVDSSRKARIAYGGAASGTIAVSEGERLAVSAQFAAGNSRLLVNGVQSSASADSPTVLPDIAIWIFRAAYGIPTVTVSPCSARLYSLTITVNGTLVRDYIPVRVGTAGYLFDRVSGQLFGNAGTGDFVLGPDTFAQGVVPTRMMAMGVRKKEALGSVRFSRVNSNTTGLMRDNLFTSIPSTWTITAWAKSAETPNYGGIFKLGWCNTASGGGGAGVGLGIGNTSFSSDSPGTNAVVLTEAAAWTSFGSAGTITGWHHYAVTKSGNTIKVYVDGSLLSSKSLGNITTGACPFSIGSGHTLAEVPSTFTSRLFDGNITRVAMWTSELSSSQVQTDYADRGSSPSQTTNLVHFWPLSGRDKYLLDTIGGATLTSSVNAAFSNDTPFA